MTWIRMKILSLKFSKTTSHSKGWLFMAKPLAKVKVGDLLKAEKMNEIIARINELEKRIAKLESKAPKRKIPEKKTLRVKNPKRKSLKVKTPKRKILKRKSPKTGLLSRIALVK
jgi:hypothetical protein